LPTTDGRTVISSYILFDLTLFFSGQTNA